MTQINIAKSATQTQRTGKEKGIHSTLIFTESLIIILYDRTLSHLALELDIAKCREDKYFLKDEIHNIIKLRGSQPFQNIIIVFSIISLHILTELCLLITGISRTQGQHPTLLKA